MLRWSLVVMVLSVAAMPLPAQTAAKVGIAVLPLENGGSYGRDKEEFDGLRRGLAGILSAELGRIPAVSVADRYQIQRLVDDQGAGVSERIDAQTAVKIGRTASARYVIAASFIDLYGDFHLDARIIDAESGQVVKVVKSDSKLSDRKQAFRIIQSVVQRVAESLNLGLPSGSSRNIPTDAISFYGRALLYQDRGDRKKAADFYGQALRIAPDFTEAQDGMRRADGN